MKLDRVLTMGECLASWYGGVSYVNPPADGARHVPITAKSDAELKDEAHPCRCDRWGHPCPGCIDKPEPQSRTAPHDFSSAKQVR
jgi:hypothetical protein